MTLAKALEFPALGPADFTELAAEPLFDPGRHLALEKPETVTTLAELGYSDEEIAACPSTLGITSCFRILSDEGVACLIEVARNLAPYARSVERISRMVRGGAYQSKFLRDLCQSPEITAALSEIYHAPILPHSIPHQLGHLNYNPETVGENVDKWHVDTLRLDYVMFVTDPNAIAGGEFEYFHGTKHEMADLAARGETPPLDRVVAPNLPGPGYAVLQQGNMVVHRAKALRQAGERITMVNGYVPAEIGFPDYTRFDQLYLADPAHVAASEFARHVAWMGREMLSRDIDDVQFAAEKEQFAARLDAVADMLHGAAAEIRNADEASMEHFGD
jgi:hypothetical protein